MSKTAIILSAVVAIACAPSTAAAQWAFFGEERQLSGKTIVDVGVVTSEEKRVVPPYDPNSKSILPPLGRQIFWREFHGERVYCFEDPKGYGSFEKKAAILLADSPGSGVRYLATITSSSSVEVKIEIVTPIACPG